MFETLGFAALIFFMRVFGNTITTMRLVFLNQGKTFLVTVLGFFEALIFTVALGAVVNNLDSLFNLFVYCLGYAVGSHLGMWLEQKFTLGYVLVRAISRQNGHPLAVAVREAGLGATEITGKGAEGDVIIVESVVERHNLGKCMDALRKADPSVFIFTNSIGSRERGFIPTVRPGMARFTNR